jgi:hypothetical protein
MNASLQAVLTDAERLMVAETEPAELDPLTEDEAVELQSRIRRARNKYIGQYRRGASARVAEQGGRGRARPQSQRAAMKAEAFEEALARVSRRVAVLARRAAAELRSERLAAARAARRASGSAAAPIPATRRPRAGTSSRAVASRHGSGLVPAQAGGSAGPGRPAGDRALRSPASAKSRASTRAIGARRQAKRDGR